ncbi:MAG: hypothetical protein ABI886_09205, partial [Betaproteobacteria bacterium]
VQPASAATGSVQAWLSSDLSGTLTVGTAYTATTSRAGQNLRLTLSGTAGPSPALEFAGLAFNAGSPGLSVVLYKPDGTTWTSTTLTATGTTWTLPPFPVTGTYTVFVEPWTSHGGAATITALQLTPEAGAALAIDGAAVAGTFATVGESARFVFSGTAGQNLGLGFTGLTLSAGTYANVTAFKPDGNQLTSDYCYLNGTYCSLNLSNLPATGTYSVVVQPASAATGSVQAWLSSDLTGTLTVGTAYTATTTRAGQNLRLTFVGAASQLLRLTTLGMVTAPAGQLVDFKIIRPDQSVHATTSSGSASYSYDIAALTVAGTYALFVEPRASGAGAATVTMSITLSNR